MAPRYDTAAWSPWIAAESLEAKIRFIDMAGGLLGACDWFTRSIYIRNGVTEAQSLCVAAHEVLHLKRGPYVCPTERMRRRDEEIISIEVARLLIPLPRLIDAVAWSSYLAEQAEVLGVDTFTVRTRLDHLDRWEADMLHGMFGEEVA